MGGRRAGCVPERPRRLAARVGAAFLALTALAGAALDAQSDAQPKLGPEARVFELVRQPVDSAEMASALLSLLDELESTPGDEAERARYLIDLALSITAGEAPGDDLGAALAEFAARDAEHTVWSSFELANALQFNGRAAEADDVARFALETPAVAAARLAPQLWHVRAELARLDGRWTDAEELFGRMEAAIHPDAALADDALALATNHEFRSRVHIGHGQVLLELGVLDGLREHVARAEEEARLSGARSPLLAAHLLAIDRSLMSDDAASALEDAREFLADPQFEESPLILSAAGRAQIEIARDESDVEKRRSALDDAGALLAKACELGLSPPEQLQGDLSLCDVELSLADATAARASLGRAEALLAKMGVGAPSLDAPREFALLALCRWRLAVLENAAPEERARRRAELVSAHERLLERWAAAPSRQGGIGFLHWAWRADLASEVVRAELEATEGAPGVERALEHVLAVQALGTLARQKHLPPVSCAKAREELLAPGRGMLVLFLARDRSHLFLIEGTKAEHRLLPGREPLLDLAAEVSGSFQRHEDAPATLRALHDALVPKDLRASLEKLSEAWIVGFEPLGVPFGVLGTEEKRPWGARIACAAVPSAAMAIDLADEPRSEEKERLDLALVVAAKPPPALRFPELPFRDRDRDRLLAPFPEAKSIVLEGAKATLPGLLEQRAALEHARVVHFLAHGTWISGRESGAALVLNEGGDPARYALDAAAIAQLRFDGLVVLSACRAARGPLRIGDDRLVHLGGEFLAAGARAVILTRFPIEYGATLDLMEELHARLAKGDVPAKALRAALATASGRAGTADPALGTFEVLGLGFDPWPREKPDQGSGG